MPSTIWDDHKDKACPLCPNVDLSRTGMHGQRISTSDNFVIYKSDTRDVRTGEKETFLECKYCGALFDKNRKVVN
ncbi:uncharacterized protein METZ01_LOCUS194723 [marine metagenome]|uniref:Uncharacterized protein n=1 Tax=marine metagenome TaxID=408172 RepID=A0A382DUM9_9ZZZZ